MTTDRIETFSDGVFAVAITLLVLDIHVPDAGSTSQLWHGLGHLWPNYASYAVSFLVIGIIWVNHHGVMDVIARANRQIAFLNVVLLLTVAVIPFSTSLMARYLQEGGGRSHVAAAVYSAVFTLMGAAFASLWLYASRGGRLLVDGYTEAELRGITRRFVSGTPVYLVTIGVAFLSAVACLALHAALAVFYALAERGGGVTRPAAAAEPRG
jgi:uncharacterized membrane protein